MKYIKLFENWTHSLKIKDIVSECEEILRELEDIGFIVEVDAYYDTEGYYDIAIKSENYFKLDQIEPNLKHLLSYLYEDENISIYTTLTFSPDRENGRPKDYTDGNITRNGDTLTCDRYKFEANINNKDLLFETLPNIKYDSIKLFLRSNFND